MLCPFSYTTQTTKLFPTSTPVQFFLTTILILRNNLQLRREKRDCELEIILVVLGVELSSQCMGIYRGRRASCEHPNVGVGRPPHKHYVSKF